MRRGERRTGATRQLAREMSAPPEALGALLERFDRDAFDMPRGRARVRLGVKGHGAWDLEVQRHRHRVRRANTDNEAHAELTDWIVKNPEEAQKLIKAELLAETKSDMAPDLIAQSWKRIVFTAETPRASVESFMQNSVKAGFIKSVPDLSKLFEKP